MDDPRQKTRAIPRPVNRTERTVSGLVCAWLVVVPWIIGGRLWWIQVLAAGLGAVTFAIALKTRENRQDLVRFPIFWLGLLFGAWVLCQALNPWAEAHPISENAFIWSVGALPYVSWLPSGIQADFTEMSTWRALVYWTAPWLMVCAWWVAVRRRKSVWRLLWVVWANGIVLSLVGVVQAFYPTDRVMWFYQVPGAAVGAQVFSSFSNRNPAAMYLYLLLAAGLALALHLQKQAREAHDSGLHWVVLVGSSVTVAALVADGSRAGLAGEAAILLLGLLMLAVGGARVLLDSPARVLAGVLLMISLAVGMFLVFERANLRSLDRWRYRPPLAQFTLITDARASLWPATLHMIDDRMWLGWGGGSYRYVSPDYFRAANVFRSTEYYAGLGMRANQAHSDWLQFPMEYGVIGASVLLAMLLYWYGRILFLFRWLGGMGWMAVFGLLVLTAHSAMDFPFYNAAVLGFYVMLLAAVVKIASLNARRAVAAAPKGKAS